MLLAAPVKAAKLLKTKDIAKVGESFIPLSTNQQKLIQNWSKKENRVELINSIFSDPNLIKDPNLINKLAKELNDQGLYLGGKDELKNAKTAIGKIIANKKGLKSGAVNNYNTIAAEATKKSMAEIRSASEAKAYLSYVNKLEELKKYDPQLPHYDPATAKKMFYEAHKKLFSTKKGSRAAFKSNRPGGGWDAWKNILKEERPDLYEYFKPIAEPPKIKKELVKRKISASLLNEFDVEGQTIINNFNNEMFNLTGFTKSADSMKVLSPVNRFINAGLRAVKEGRATKSEILEQLNKVDQKKLAEILKKNSQIRNKLKKARELGVDLDDLNLSHMEAVADNWKTSLDANNLFLATTKKNQQIQRNLNKSLKNIFEEFKGAKTVSEKKEIVKNFQNVKKELIDNNLVSIIDGKRIGADIDFETSFKTFSTAADKALHKRLFKKEGGLVGMDYLTRPI